MGQPCQPFRLGAKRRGREGSSLGARAHSKVEEEAKLPILPIADAISTCHVFENVKAWSLWLLDYDWLRALSSDGKCSVAISPCSALGKSTTPESTTATTSPRARSTKDCSPMIGRAKGFGSDGRASEIPCISWHGTFAALRTERRMQVSPRRPCIPRKRCSDQCCASQGLSSSGEAVVNSAA